jgi:putative transposase
VEEIFAERNVKVDHSTLNRWVIKYSSSLALAPTFRTPPSKKYVKLRATYYALWI